MLSKLTGRDNAALTSRWITPKLAKHAGLFRVSSADGAQLVGRNGSGNYSGLAIPNTLPGQAQPREYLLRRDFLDLVIKANGRTKEQEKYLYPPGRNNLLYFPPGTTEKFLQDATMPVAVVEGPLKALATHRLANHETENPRFCPVAINGCWGHRGRVGKTTGPNGERRDVKGPIPDLDRIAWDGRLVYLVPDTNVVNNSSVEAAWREFGKELERRGTRTVTVEIPQEPGVNGVDDLLARWGPERVLELFEKARPRNTSRDFHSTDAGNAERLVDRHGRDLRFIEAWGWRFWDGPRWQVDDIGEVGRRALETVREILAEAAKLEDKGERKKLAGFAFKSESRASISNLTKLAEDLACVRARPAEFDCNPWLLNVKNGTLDLQNGKLPPHNREDMITRLAPVEWNPAADRPIFLSFLNQIINGNKALILFVQKLVGYCLTGLTTEQILIILWGCGANGKTTLVEVLSALLGEYAAKSPVSTFLLNRNDSIPNDLAALQGVRFVYASEVDEGRRLAESLVKDVTGGERIRARFLHKEFFEYKPEFKLWLSTNHKPVIRGSDHAIWRRIRLVPFEVTFPNEKQDKRLAEKLKTELPGILRWAVEGCLAWQREGLEPPKEVVQATDTYREEMDTLAAFLRDCTETDATGGVSAKELYRTYCAWCEQNGERPGTQTSLGIRLNERGFDRTHKASGTWWIGIRLREEEGED